MAQFLSGPNGKEIGVIDLEGSTSAGTRIISITTETAVNVFKDTTIRYNSLLSNQFNLFQFLKADRNGKFKFGKFGAKKHVITAFRNGCIWNPKTCSMDFTSGEINLCELEVQEENCPDDTWNSCWEGFTTGDGLLKRDIFATAEGRALMKLAVDSTYEAIGNGINDLVWYGSHPLIETANTNEWYLDAGITQTEWDCFIDQMRTCGGLMTAIDALKSEGENNYNVDIGSYSGKKYTGIASELFDRLIDEMPTKMQIHDKRASRNAGRSFLLVSRSVFAKYKADIIATYGNIAESYYLFTGGEDHNCTTCPQSKVRGVLEYDGHWVICMDEWDMLGNMTNTYTHRAILTVPRVFAIATKSNILGNQYGGMGMTILQRMGAPYMGKIFLNAAWEMGAAIVDKDFIINASVTVQL